MSSCKSCGAEILWVTMAGSRKKMPIDVEGLKVVVPAGVAADGVERGVALHKVVVGHTSHFATCPNAAEHRKVEG
jgi:hypothetical protein